MKNAKKIGLIILVGGIVIPYLVFYVKTHGTLYEYWGSRYMMTLCIPPLIVAYVLLFLEKSERKLDFFGKLILSFLFSVWFVISVLLILIG